MLRGITNFLLRRMTGYTATSPEGIPLGVEASSGREQAPIQSSQEQLVWVNPSLIKTALQGARLDETPTIASQTPFRIFTLAVPNSAAVVSFGNMEGNYLAERFKILGEIPAARFFSQAIKAFSIRCDKPRSHPENYEALSDLAAYAVLPKSILNALGFFHAQRYTMTQRYILEGLKRNPSSPYHLKPGDQVVLGPSFLAAKSQYLPLDFQAVAELFTKSDSTVIEDIGKAPNPYAGILSHTATIVGAENARVRVLLTDLETVKNLDPKLHRSTHRKLEVHAAEEDCEDLAATVLLAHSGRKSGKISRQVYEKYQRRSSQARSLESVMEELNSLVGMTKLKEQVRTWADYLAVQKVRRSRGLGEGPLSLHAVFEGPPGTGKTTVVRLLGEIYKELGLLSTGHVIEVGGRDLVGEYVGHTEPKVHRLVDSAKGGILFIDEAYALAMENGGRDFGPEAVAVLIQRMENDREDLAIVFAGYPDQMERFIDSNPGFRSRIGRTFKFEHYEPKELTAIFKRFCDEIRIAVEPEAETALESLFMLLCQQRDKTFGNGRLARNIFVRTLEKQAVRLMKSFPEINKVEDEALNRIVKEDLPADEFVETSPDSKLRRIGFA